ncbi:MAG: dual specificity protein phosphatase family protein [Aggregatilineales bacterium]
MKLKTLFRPFILTYEFLHIIFRRLRKQGLRTTLQWLHAVGLPFLTGRMTLRYSQILPKLYLGPQYGVLGKKTLEEAGVSASMSLRSEYNDQDFGLSFPEYSYLPTVDNTAPSLEHLDQGVAFIKRMLDDDRAVYVHCGSGVGRAPTAVAAYLIAEKGMTVEEAIKTIKDSRPFIRVLPPQIERLHEYKEHIKYADPEEALDEAVIEPLPSDG